VEQSALLAGTLDVEPKGGAPDENQAYHVHGDDEVAVYGGVGAIRDLAVERRASHKADGGVEDSRVALEASAVLARSAPMV